MDGALVQPVTSQRSAHARRGVVLDLVGKRVDLSSEEAFRLREVAEAHAGYSSTARDLALLLEDSLSHQRVRVLRRREIETLAQLARSVHLETVADRLSGGGR